MKRTDIAMLVLIVGISLIAAYFIGKAVLDSFTQQAATVEVTDTINPAITEPDSTVFNSNAINPAVPIEIGGSNNQKPFGQ